jgi:hypothetical protein
LALFSERWNQRIHKSMGEEHQAMLDAMEEQGVPKLKARPYREFIGWCTSYKQ